MHTQLNLLMSCVEISSMLFNFLLVIMIYYNFLFANVTTPHLINLRATQCKVPADVPQAEHPKKITLQTMNLFIINIYNKLIPLRLTEVNNKQTD